MSSVKDYEDSNQDVDVVENESNSELLQHEYAHTDTESEYEEVDITENPLYQVLSVFFEDDNGKNLCSKLDDITDAINRNTRVQQALLKHLASNNGSSGNNRSTRSSDRRSRQAPRKQ